MFGSLSVQKVPKNASWFVAWDHEYHKSVIAMAVITLSEYKSCAVRSAAWYFDSPIHDVNALVTLIDSDSTVHMWLTNHGRGFPVLPIMILYSKSGIGRNTSR